MSRPAKLQTAHIAAPLGGLNTVDSASTMPPTDCVYAYNVMPAEGGLRARLGYPEWCTGLSGASDNTVRTIVPFTGSAANGSKNKLFAVSSLGIWDATNSTATPSRMINFATQAGDAGRGVSTVMVTSAGHFLPYCDEVNGYHVYSEASGAWTAVTQGVGASQISGVDPANLVHVAVFKNRIWFTERNSTRGWYLDVGSIYGTATSFDFGRQFRQGGSLVGLWNWTYDGGSGMDDSLVAISDAGDVVIYQGTDPSSPTTFGLKGVWSVGGVPKGRRIVTSNGGDVLILSGLGILPLSKLVLGANVEDDGIYATRKVSNLFSDLVSTYGGNQGWAMHIHPRDNALMVTIPKSPGQATEQISQSLSSGGWFPYRGLPIHSAAVWEGDLYFGTADGRVCINRGYVDNVSLSDPTSWSAVAYSFLPAFQTLDNLRMKQVKMLRPTVHSQTPSPAIQVTARYGYDKTEPTAPSGNGGGGSGAWDSALWDSATWGGDYSVSQPLVGATGMGREVSVAVQGNSISLTTVVGVDVMFEQGGVL